MAKNRLGSAVVISLSLGLATAMQACGDNGDSLSQFVGTWEYTQSVGTFACTGVAPAENDLTGRKIWGEGVMSSLVDLSDSCFYRFDVKDKVATIQATQTCTFSNGDLETPSSWRFSLLSPTEAEEVVATSVDELTGPCTFNASSKLTKISKD
jgi:hypothetical protein